MKKNIVHFAIIAVLVITVLIVFNDPDDQLAAKEQEITFEQLQEGNTQILAEISHLEEELDSVKSINFQDFLHAKDVVESFYASETIGEAKNFLTDHIQFSDNLNGDEDRGTLHINGGSGLKEWLPNTLDQFELKKLGNEMGNISLTYTSNTNKNIPITYIIAEEDEIWKIDHISR